MASNRGAENEDEEQQEANYASDASFCSNNRNNNAQGSDVDSRTEGDDMAGDGDESGDGNLRSCDIDFRSLTGDAIMQMQFKTPDLAYRFYNEFGRNNGFSVRRSKTVKNKMGEIVRYTYVCSREGFREKKWLTMMGRRREHKAVTRCGCKAQMRIKLDGGCSRWYVCLFNNDHNHEVLGRKYVELLRSHRKMYDADIAQMNSLREVGISIPKIYQSFASQSGGFSLVGFRKRDMYNEIEKQRKLQDGDAKGAFEYLNSLLMNDPMVFWRFQVDGVGKLVHLFWCDGMSRSDYSVFGDVLAFDATYGMNKYKLPLIVFSGVNHHNQTCVFGSAVVSDETEETYVWVLQQFVEAMNGKAPKSVITDGDLAMRKAIKAVFPGAHHRLCAWHLLRNATANVGKPRFTQLLKICMLSDIEIDEFECKWERMVEECGVSNVEWVVELYKKKSMWANAYIRGNFFAGFRTTSRCEALHAKIGKFVESRHNLTEFLAHFQRCVENLRNSELEADFNSFYGHPVLQTELRGLEKSGSMVFTREIFQLYRAVLMKVVTVKILDCKVTSMGKIYIVGKYCKPHSSWHVSHCPESMDFRCSCLRMESFGLPCIHIIAVMVHLDADELPRCLVLDRWTKRAKQSIESRILEEPLLGESRLYRARVGSFVHHCRRLAKVACLNDDDYFSMWDKVANETLNLEAKNGMVMPSSDKGNKLGCGRVKDPSKVRTKGCGPASGARPTKRKRILRCGLCRREGHTRVTCGYMDSSLRGDDGQTDDDMANDSNGSGRIEERVCQTFGRFGQFLSSSSNYVGQQE